jgi:hypothetical protein
MIKALLIHVGRRTIEEITLPDESARVQFEQIRRILNDDDDDDSFTMGARETFDLLRGCLPRGDLLFGPKGSGMHFDIGESGFDIHGDAGFILHGDECWIMSHSPIARCGIITGPYRGRPREFGSLLGRGLGDPIFEDAGTTLQEAEKIVKFLTPEQVEFIEDDRTAEERSRWLG